MTFFICQWLFIEEVCKVKPHLLLLNTGAAYLLKVKWLWLFNFILYIFHQQRKWGWMKDILSIFLWVGVEENTKTPTEKVVWWYLLKKANGRRSSWLIFTRDSDGCHNYVLFMFINKNSHIFILTHIRTHKHTHVAWDICMYGVTAFIQKYCPL